MNESSDGAVLGCHNVSDGRMAPGSCRVIPRSEGTTAEPVSCTVDRGEVVAPRGRERGDEPILGSWEEGGWVVGLGKEGIGAVADHCSGMRQAFWMMGEGDW